MAIVDSREVTAIITDGIIQIDLPDSVTGLTTEHGWKSYKIKLSDFVRDSFTIREVTSADNNETADNGNAVKFNSASNFDFTLDQMTTGHRCDLINVNTGVVTLVAGSGVTIRYENTNRKMDTQYTGVSLLYLSATEVVVVGKLSA